MLEGKFAPAAALILAVVFAASFLPIRNAAAGDQFADAATQPVAQPGSSAPGAQSSGQTPQAQKGIRAAVRRALSKINPMKLVRDRQYRKARAAFPGFCRHWADLLHERELYNRTRVKWVVRDGYQTATYTGYGDIDSCTCERSAQGFAIGKLTYDEFTYYLAGKTRAQARRATPQVADTTATTELFRWDHGKWFY